MKYGFELLIGLLAGAFLCLADSIRSEGRLMAAMQKIEARLDAFPQSVQQTNNVEFRVPDNQDDMNARIRERVALWEGQH